MATKTGRPTLYSKSLGDSICVRLAGGESLRSVCRDEDMPSRQTVYDWLVVNKVFLDQYESCRNVGYDELFDDLQDIADLSDDEESPMRSRLRVDTRKWYLSKVLPKKYGDKLDLTSGGEKLPTPLLHVLPKPDEPKG